MSLILGIESSCDETAAAVVEDGLRVRGSIIASQHDLHRRYRGVVPEIASRAHLERISPVLQEALQQADVSFADVDAVAVGNRPGLIGSLLVGVSAAKALAWALGRPLIGVDHVQAHLYAGALVDQSGKMSTPPVAGAAPEYPALGLVVSGGHTSLYDVAAPTQMMLLGRTIDDAVGEAYDKAAVILGVDFPGGPLLDRLAQKGDRQAVEDLPRSLLGADSLDFSFSGLKTALLYRVRGTPKGRGAASHFERSYTDLSEQERANLAAAFQFAAIETLIVKLRRAALAMAQQRRTPRCLVIGGGVSANSYLRLRTTELAGELGIPAFLPAMKFCLDNAAMIAGLAYEFFRDRRYSDLDLPAMATTAL